MKKSKFVYISMLLALCVFIILVFYWNQYTLSEAYIRERYPYCIDGYPPGGGLDPIVRQYVDLSWFTKNDTALLGEVVTIPELVRARLIPDENSIHYSGRRNYAQMKQVSIEESITELGYYRFQFRLDDIIYDGLDWNELENEIVDLYISSTSMYACPKLKKGDKFILFANGVYMDNERGFRWEGHDFFYVSERNRVYSYENVEALNQYSGMKVKEMQKEIVRVRNR